MTDDKKLFIQWLQARELARSTAYTYVSHLNMPLNKRTKRAHELFDVYKEEQAEQAEQADLNERIEELEQAEQENSILKIIEIEQKLKSELHRNSKLKEKITELDEVIQEHKRRIEYLQTNEGYLKKELQLIGDRVDNRQKLVLIRFIDGSCMGFPSDLRFLQVENSIKNEEIEKMEIITVDWEL